jgi:hypothetical protein
MPIMVYLYGALKIETSYAFIKQDLIVPMTTLVSETGPQWRIAESVGKFDGFKATQVRMKSVFAKSLTKIAEATSDIRKAANKDWPMYKEVWEDLTRPPAVRYSGIEFAEEWEYEDYEYQNDDGTSDVAEGLERVEILSSTPNHIQDVFGHLALAGRHGKADPALVLSPFSIPPGSLRDRWMAIFHEVRVPILCQLAPTNVSPHLLDSLSLLFQHKASGQLDALPMLVYFYGGGNRDAAYSLVDQDFLVPLIRPIFDVEATSTEWSVYESPHKFDGFKSFRPAMKKAFSDGLVKWSYFLTSKDPPGREKNTYDEVCADLLKNPQDRDRLGNLGEASEPLDCDESSVIIANVSSGDDSDFEMPLRSTEKDKASQLGVSKRTKCRKRRASLVDLERGPSSNPLDVDDPPPTESRGRRKRVSVNNLSSLCEELDSIGRHVDRIQVRMKRLRTLLQQPCSDS